MADVQINDEIRYSRYGSIAFVWDGASDDYILNFRVDNSLRIKLGGQERHPWDYNNNALVTTRRQGRPLPSTISFRVKRGDLIGANELYTNMLAAGTDGNVPPFTLKVELLDGEGVATGELLTFDDCTFEGGFEFSEGQDMDEVTVEITCPHETVTPTAVT